MMTEIYDAKQSQLKSVSNLERQVDETALNTAINRINDAIQVATDEGSFSCMISNDILEDLFLSDEEAFDDTLIQCVVGKLRIAGYKVKYDELIYSDISNIIEISW